MTPTTPERWLPIAGYEGYYEVSDQGRVRSLDRTVGCCHGSTRLAKGRVLRPALVSSGRWAVCLQRDGVSRTAIIAPLVLTAFVGPRPEGMEGCHNDGDRTRDVLTNLRWDTPSENAQDRIRHGHHSQKNKTHCPQGHALAAPNLVQSRARQGQRMCLACQRARAARQAAVRRGELAFDLTAAFAQQYDRIMNP